MKNLNLNKYGVQEMNTKEMQNTDGGVLGTLLVLAVVAVTMSSCTFVVGDNNKVGGTTTTVSADSAANGNTAGTGSGNKVGKNK